MDPFRSIVFDTRFLAKKAQSGIARDSRAFLNQFYENEWSVNPLKYKGVSLEGGDDKEMPFTQVDKSLARATTESAIFGRHLKLPDSESRYFFLSQISPIRVDTKNSTCKRIIRIHDLFPVTNPEWFTLRARLHFKAGLKSINDDDLLITNSKVTTKSLLHVLDGGISAEQVWEIPCPSTNFKTSSACEECQICVEPISPLKYFLAVGTLEPRKNYVRLLAGWKKSRPSDSGYKLMIVGNFGWNDKMIISHIREQENVLHLKAICDYQLHKLYKNAFAFVSSSLNEGFNIPLHEAQNHGSRLVLSDIDIHREFASDSTVAWFNPLNEFSITSALNDAFDVPVKSPGKVSSHSFEVKLMHFLVELSEGRRDRW
jgi:glycosyltransferase involved in cell wall biosynthesis